MRTFFFVFFFLLGFVSFGQTDSVACNYLPMARPDQVASCKDDLAKSLGKTPATLKSGTHFVVFKMSVDCKGEVLKVYYHSGNVAEADQKYFADRLIKTSWNPAVDDGGNVTSFVFLTIDVVNGKITAKLQ